MWPGNGVGIGSQANGYTGTATLTVSGSMGSLFIPSDTCPLTFNVPHTMQPGPQYEPTPHHASKVPATNSEVLYVAGRI
jgi:hypothetical protein